MAGWDAWMPALAGFSAEELRESILRMKPYIVNTIVADYQAHTRYAYVNELTNYKTEQPVMRAVPPGEGIIDYKTWFKALKEIGYQGWAVYEMCEVLDGGGSIENLDRTAKSFLEFMDEFRFEDNSLTKKEKEEGWQLLFDGKTLNGWRGFSLNKAPEGWIVENGTIKILPKTDWPRQADGQPILGADLITVNTYENFELQWDWKIGSGGNSGVKYNVSEELSVANPPKGCALGFEYQMTDDTRLSGRSMHNSTAALYDLVPPASEKIVNPIGEFNTSRIIFSGNRGEHWLNGKKILEFDLDSSPFQTAVENSKFKDVAGFAAKRNGHIVLQDHAEEAWFKNIKIKKLD